MLKQCIHLPSNKLFSDLILGNVCDRSPESAIVEPVVEVNLLGHQLGGRYFGCVFAVSMESSHEH